MRAEALHEEKQGQDRDGTTASCRSGDTTSSPSTDESTEIAGVITLSP